MFAPRIVLGMMQRDEETRLEAWILYHARLFGFDALYIFDNGSVSPAVLGVLEKYRALGVHVDYRHTGTEGFHKKGFLISRLFQQLEADRRNRFFIPLDCDEFFTLRAADGVLTADRALIFGMFETLLGDPHILLVPQAHANILGHPGHFFQAYAHRKVFFTEDCVRGMAEGFHNAQSRKLNEEKVTEFVYLHFHYRPHAEMVLQSAGKLGHFVDVTKPEAVARYQGTADHVAKFLTMDAEEYARTFYLGDGIYLPWFVPLCESIGVDREFLNAI